MDELFLGFFNLMAIFFIILISKMTEMIANSDASQSPKAIRQRRTKKCLTLPVQTVRILNLEIWMEYGPVAQLGARFNRTEEVEGSNPSRSIRG